MVSFVFILVEFAKLNLISFWFVWPHVYSSKAEESHKSVLWLCVWAGAQTHQKAHRNKRTRALSLWSSLAIDNQFEWRQHKKSPTNSMFVILLSLSDTRDEQKFLFCFSFEKYLPNIWLNRTTDGFLSLFSHKSIECRDRCIHWSVDK